MCNGVSAQCPTSEPKANFTACHGETQVCLNGVRDRAPPPPPHLPRTGLPQELRRWHRPGWLLTRPYAPPPQGCSGSICEKYGLEACTCASQDGKDETELCHVCCMEKSESFHLLRPSRFRCIEVFWITMRGFFFLPPSPPLLSLTPPAVNPNTCSSTRSERLARFFNKKEITLPAGSPCNEFKGYCDVFMKCRLVDADGPLARLKKAIFNPELYENIAEWIVVRVWSVPAETAIVAPVVAFRRVFPSSSSPPPPRLTGGLCY